MSSEPLLDQRATDSIDQWLHGCPADFLGYLQRVFADTDLGDAANDDSIGAIRTAT